MKSSIIALSALLLAAASAQPHGRSAAHRHADKHAKRELVIVTDYVDITETVLLTATVWVDKKGNTISPPVTGEAKSTAQGKPVTSTHSPAVFYEPAPTPTPKVEAPKKQAEPTTSAAPPPPAPAVDEPKPVVVEESKQAPPPPPPAQTTTIKIAPADPKPVVEAPKQGPPPPPPAPVVEEPKPEPEPITEAPKAPVVEQPQQLAPSPPAEVAAAPAPATAFISGPCAPGSPCTGDITFYTAGLGACGQTHDGLSEAVVALPHGMMGTQSNGNPFCGRSVSITKNGKTTSAVVVDKCMGCADGDLDLSEKAFAALGIDQSVGRTTAEWHFTS